MSLFHTIIRLLAFLISSFGWWEHLRRNTDIDPLFLPSLTISIQVVILFFFGLVNCLSAGVYCLHCLGFLFLICSLWKNESLAPCIRPFWNSAFLCFFLAVLAAAVYFRGKVFHSLDDFTHWALVVREMLSVNRFPTANETLIIFQAYPLGSSVFIYFFSKLVSPSESVQMLAQAFLSFSMLLPLFLFAKKNRLFTVPLLLLVSLSFFHHENQISNLLVDTLLALVGACGLLFAILYCGKGAAAKNLLLSVFYTVFLVQIKNSGIFFAAVIGFYILYSAPRDRLSLRLFALLFTVLTIILWKAHCSSVYLNAENTQHALSLSNYRNVLQGRTPADIAEIFGKCLAFSLSNIEAIILASVFLLLGRLVRRYAAEKRPQFRAMTKASLIVYSLFQLGTFIMYIVSMPIGEAKLLASALRYVSTIAIFILYFCTALILEILSSIPKETGSRVLIKYVLPAILAIVIFPLYSAVTKSNTVSQEEGRRAWVESLAEEFQIPGGESYCTIIPEFDRGYMSYLCRYLFRSTETSFTYASSEEALNGIQEKYIFLYDSESDLLKSWVAKNYPEQVGNEVIIRGG